MTREGFKRGQKWAACALLALFISPTVGLADEFRPALLEITEREDGWVDVTWKVPVRADRVLALTPILPEFLEPLGAGSGRRVPGAWVEYSSYRTAGHALTGATLRIDACTACPSLRATGWYASGYRMGLSIRRYCAAVLPPLPFPSRRPGSNWLSRTGAWGPFIFSKVSITCCFC